MRAFAAMIFLAALTVSPAQAACGAKLSRTVIAGLPAHPFAAVASADGCSIFVSLMGQGRHMSGGVALLRRDGDTLAAVRGVSLSGRPAMLALTRDETLLIVAEDSDVAFIDATKLAAGDSDAVLGKIAAGGMDGAIGVALTPDERTLFVSDERGGSIVAIDLQKARASGFGADALLGRIPVGRAPVGLAVSGDGKLLYSTSEVAPANLNLPDACARENSSSPSPDHAEGILTIIDVAKARDDAQHAVLAQVPAGCNPVRVVLSADGARAYVSARGGNAVNVFDTAKLTGDSAHARIAGVPTGKSPVGMALSADDARLIVTNSDRFGEDRTASEMLNVIDTARIGEGAAAIVDSVAVGAFPRELRITSDNVLLVTNFGSNSLQLVPMSTLK